MDHIVILDSGKKEFDYLINGTKTMIIIGSDLKCIPYGMVSCGDVLYFVECNNRTNVKARGVVSSVYNSYQLTKEESFQMIIRNQDKLNLTDDLFYKWAGKKYLVLIGLKDVEKVKPFNINWNTFFCSDCWCPAVDIENSVSQGRITA